MLNVDKMKHSGTLECKRTRSLSQLIENIMKMPKLLIQSQKISNDQELIQSDTISYPQNQKGNN